MDITFKVHDAPSKHKRSKTVKLNEEDIEADVPYLEVELINDSDHGSIALRFTSPKDIEEASKLFTAGATVTVSFGVPNGESV